MRLKTKNLIYQLSYYYYCSCNCWVVVAKLVKFCFKIRTGKFSKQKWYCLFVKRTDFDDKLKNLNKKDYFKSNKTCICWKWIIRTIIKSQSNIGKTTGQWFDKWMGARFLMSKIFFFGSILKLFKTTWSILVALLRFIRGNLMKY